MNFKKAMKALREGKRIRRPCWKEGSYWILGFDEKILFGNSKDIMHTREILLELAQIHLSQIEADDWEIFKL